MFIVEKMWLGFGHYFLIELADMDMDTTLWSLCAFPCPMENEHYNEVIMGTIASQINSLTIIYSIVYSDADQRKHQSSTSLAFVRGIHRGPVNSPHKWPVTLKMCPFDDVIMGKINDMPMPSWSTFFKMKVYILIVQIWIQDYFSIFIKL